MINPDDAEEHAQVWAQVVNQVPPSVSAAPLALLGMAAWIGGNGALQNCCCEELDRLHPATRWAGCSPTSAIGRCRRSCGTPSGAACGPNCGVTWTCWPGKRSSTRLAGMTRFVVCGETLIDLVQSDDGTASSSARPGWRCRPGGPMNSAVALGKLGADVHFLGRLSSDAFGRQLRQHILAAGVQLDLATESSQATSIAVVSLDDEGVASYTFHFTDTANFGWQADDLPSAARPTTGCTSPRCPAWSAPAPRCCSDWMRDGAGRGVLRHQRAPDGHHRPGGLLGEGAAVAAGGRPARAASSRPATRTSSSWPGPGSGGPTPVERSGRRRGGGWSSTASGWPWSPSARAAAWRSSRAARSPACPGFRPRWSTPSAPATPSWPGSSTAASGRGCDLEASLRRGAAAASIVCSRQGAQPPTSAEVEALLAARLSWRRDRRGRRPGQGGRRRAGSATTAARWPGPAAAVRASSAARRVGAGRSVGSVT